MSRRAALLFLALAALALATAGGCGGDAARYAREARSGYIGVRAVMVGLQEFPARVGLLLRSGYPDTVRARIESEMEDARGLVPSVRSAIASCRESCELLRDTGSEEYLPYAESLLQLLALNEQVVEAYNRFIAFTDSLLQSVPYARPAGELMPSLERLDGVAAEIDGLLERIRGLEEEAEATYRAIKD